VYKDYETAAVPALNTINASGATISDKRKGSEELGSLASIAYNAVRHGSTFAVAQGDHTEFMGCGVFDLVYVDATTGKVEVKEAKGGGSSYGDCWDISHKKRVKQCTPEYNDVIIHKMKHSNYRGRHPTVSCVPHGGTPIPSCPHCKQAEATHRQNTGLAVEKALGSGDFSKIAVRGDYDGNCLKAPQKLDAYSISSTGIITSF